VIMVLIFFLFFLTQTHSFLLLLKMTVKVDNFSPETDFAKRLASNEKETRDEALKDLSVYLTSYKEEKPMVELLKLWKGLFYCK
jgi:hypothetical protein